MSQLDSMMGNLQSDMSRQGVATVTKGVCAACSKPIVGQVCTALGQTWHPEHFTCAVCEVALGTKTFFERDGKPYCEEDYHEEFAPRCAHCEGAILDVSPSMVFSTLVFILSNNLTALLILLRIAMHVKSQPLD